MVAYYNEICPNAIAMLEQLMADGLIEHGMIDGRSIDEVTPEDLKGFNQCHFFAGIGGWAYALQLAGYNGTEQVWTGSPPCQPYSTGGKREGKNDQRHKWPSWYRLIDECRPAKIFGEQVAAAITLGWLDDVANDLEKSDYAFGSCVLSSLCIKAPDNRERIFFVGYSEHNGRHETSPISGIDKTVFDCPERSNIPLELTGTGSSGMLPYEDIFWRGYPHGKTKAIKPGICLLADGVPSAMAEIHALGNAINPLAAAEFIKSCDEAIGEIK